MYYITYQSLHTQLLQNAPDDGPMRSETCRANKKCWINLLIKTTLCILLDYIYIKEFTSSNTLVSRQVSNSQQCNVHISVCDCQQIYPGLHNALIDTEGWRVNNTAAFNFTKYWTNPGADSIIRTSGGIEYNVHSCYTTYLTTEMWGRT